jgi:hypothetical protein
VQTRSGHVEDLPPLELRRLRDLVLDGEPSRLSAASGVARRGDAVYVIGDDQPSLGVFSLTSGAPGAWRPAVPQGGEGKRDLEALTVLPPFAGHPYGALMGLGSGSEPGRDRGFVWGLRADGALRGEPVQLDLAPVHALLRERVEGLNVEGACVMGDRLWLLHRGGPRSPNVVAQLALDAVLASVASDGRIDPHELAGTRAYDLGELDGVPLAFSDATPLGGEVLVFTASAEAQGGATPDGAIHGSVVGTIDADGEVRRLRTIDRRFKVEGVHATVDTGVVDLLLVCDQDDPDAPSPLLSASMPLDPAFEREG